MARALGPLALAALVMLPRLASAQFGLLDDGLTLQIAREVHGRWWTVLYLIPETGRFFPARWLFYSIIADLVGARPLGFFSVNVLVFAAVLAILAALVRLSGGTRASVIIAALVFAVCGPAIETFYTLSKPESLQLAWIGLSLLATAASAADGRRSISRAGWATLAAGALLIAHATKETSVVLIPIALGWLAIEWRSRPADPCARRFAATYVVLTIVAAAAFAGLRWRYAAVALAEGSYTRAYGFDSVTLGAAFFRITAWLARDFAFLLPLLATGLLRLGSATTRVHRPLVYSFVWMTGWLLVYLPWPATFEYYLLPFALGAALLAGIVAGNAWSERATPRRRLVWSALVTSAVLWSVATVNAATDARVQLAVDRANGDLVNFLGTLPRDSRLVLNMTPVNEYHFELPMHLAEVADRRDVVFVAAPEAAGAGEVFVVTAEMANQPGPTVRIALHEAGVRRDNRTLGTLLSADAEHVYRRVEQIRILEIGIQRLLCRIAVGRVSDPTYCPADRGLLDRRTFAYGWQVHRLPRGGKT